MISTITIPFQKELFALLESEQKTFKHKRASYNLEKNKREIIFTIHAEDATALRACTSSICRTLVLFEKAMSM